MMSVRRRDGFTLIELLMVVVVIGILATIAIPKYNSMREKAFVASVTSDLKNLASVQEIYMSRHFTFASSVSDLPDFKLSEAVNVTINEASSAGWAAEGSHPGLGSRQCGFFFGTASPANAVPATTQGVVQCN